MEFTSALNRNSAFRRLYAKGKSAATVEVLEKDRSEWEDYYAKETDNYREMMNAIYMGGTATAIDVSMHDREICRLKAIELYRICLQVGEIEVDPI